MGMLVLNWACNLAACMVKGAFFSKPTERLSLSRLPRRQMAERRSFIPDSSALTLAPEPPLGKVEYKLKLSAQDGTERFEELVTQLNWRMRECSSEEECAEVADLSQYRDAVYRLGVADDGAVLGLSDGELAESMSVLHAMAARIPATVTVLSRRTGIAPGNKTSITALIRAQTSALSLLGQGDQVRICTVGNVDSGKSTLLGLLTQGLRDDGRGRARSSVFRHRHELETGRTSCVSTMTLGFDQIGRVVNYKEDSEGVFRSEEPQHNAGRAEAQARIAEKASKLITFFDLCGHERYFKTTLQGMVGLTPDYLLCTVDANRGELRGMVHEHLVVANALAIPTVICLTKCDVAGEGQRTSALEDVKKFMKQMGTPTFVVKDANDVVLAAERILQGFTPIFLCSAVTGRDDTRAETLAECPSSKTTPASSRSFVSTRIRSPSNSDRRSLPPSSGGGTCSFRQSATRDCETQRWDPAGAHRRHLRRLGEGWLHQLEVGLHPCARPPCRRAESWLERYLCIKILRKGPGCSDAKGLE